MKDMLKKKRAQEADARCRSAQEREDAAAASAAPPREEKGGEAFALLPTPPRPPAACGEPSSAPPTELPAAMPRESEGAELVRGADGTTSLTDARDRDELRCAINSAIQTRVESGEGHDEVLQDVEQLIAAIARQRTGGKHSVVYLPCRSGDSALSATTGSATPRNHVAVLSVNYGVSGAQVDALRELLACHCEHGTAIISVQEFKIACVSDFSPKYLLLLGAIRGQGAGAVCNLIAVRKDVFEWMDFQFSETCAEWHICLLYTSDAADE